MYLYRDAPQHPLKRSKCFGEEKDFYKFLLRNNKFEEFKDSKLFCNYGGFDLPIRNDMEPFGKKNIRTINKKNLRNDRMQ